MLSLTHIMPALDLLHIQYVFALCTLSTYVPIVVGVICVNLQELNHSNTENSAHRCILYNIILIAAATSSAFVAAYTSLVYDEYPKLKLSSRVCLIVSPLLCVTTTVLSIIRGYLRTDRRITYQHLLSDVHVCIWDVVSFALKCTVVVLTMSTAVPSSNH